MGVCATPYGTRIQAYAGKATHLCACQVSYLTGDSTIVLSCPGQQQPPESVRAQRCFSIVIYMQDFGQAHNMQCLKLSVTARASGSCASHRCCRETNYLAIFAALPTQEEAHSKPDVPFETDHSP